MYTDPTGNSEAKDTYIKDSTTLSGIDQCGKSWTDYNTKAVAAKKSGDIASYNSYVTLRDAQHTLAEVLRLNYALTDASYYSTKYNTTLSNAQDVVDQHKSTTNISSSSSSTSSTVPTAPSGYNTTQQAQYYESKIGFDIGKADGYLGVKSSSAVIITQWLTGMNVSGEADATLVEMIKSMLRAGISYDIIMAYAGKFWTPEEPTIDTSNKKSNGYLSTDDMTRLPTVSGGNAYAERNAAIGWGMMIQGALQYNKNPTAVTNYQKVNINSFALSGPNSGYRSYHGQVEAYVDWKFLGGNLAANVGKNWDDPDKAREWLSNNKKYFKKVPHWGNIPDSVTAEGGALHGYGQSDHGFGVALDMNLGNSTYCRANSPTAKWLETYGSRYGFSGLVDNPEAVKKGSAPIYKEMWHWNYMK